MTPMLLLGALFGLVGCGGSEAPPEPAPKAAKAEKGKKTKEKGKKGKGEKDGKGKGKGKAKERWPAKVSFVSPEDGATVSSPVKLEFGVEGMEVAPAGFPPKPRGQFGHHHIYVDAEPFFDENAAVPADEKHIHYGKGETKAKLKLDPGPHTLTLQFADSAHKSYGKEYATQIDIVVE